MFRSEDPRPQHIQALEKANAVRLERADLKRRLTRREVSLRECLEHPSMASCPLEELLRALPGQRRVTMTSAEYQERRARGTANKVRLAGRIMTRSEIGLYRKVGDLTERQVNVVLSWADVLTPGGCP